MRVTSKTRYKPFMRRSNIGIFQRQHKISRPFSPQPQKYKNKEFTQNSLKRSYNKRGSRNGILMNLKNFDQFVTKF